MNEVNEKNIVDKVRDFVEEECKKPTSKYGYEPFENHFKPVVQYAILLANKFGVDRELVEISAWLHDIGSIIYGRENHHITGCEIAEKKLMEFNYPKEKIELVKKCIFNHRGSKGHNLDTLEEKIIVDADSLANFDNVEGILKAAFLYENLNQLEARKSIFKKLTNKYNQLSFDYSKDIIKPKYDAVVLLFGGNEK
ncbi:HD domain-containing protein [archaeon]|nr:HD domain-containing protein [archaeon]